MSDLTLITAAVAAAASAGFLAALALSLVLGLSCLGLRRKLRTLRRGLASANGVREAQAARLSTLYSQKAGLTFENARLRGRVRDLVFLYCSEKAKLTFRNAALSARIQELLLQRRTLGCALFDALDELNAQALALSAARIEARSANRQRYAAEARAERCASELEEVEAENSRLRRRAEASRAYPLALVPTAVSLDAYEIDLGVVSDLLLPGETLAVGAEIKIDITVGVEGDGDEDRPAPGRVIEFRPAAA